MGTVLTSNHCVMGWNTRSGLDSIVNKDLCQATWLGTFDAFAEDPDALIIASVGSQADALEGIMAPPNAICVASFPQVDLLREHIDLFVTHGGQNSFTEAMANGTPVVVCPGFGDQHVNARKAVELGVGLKVDRPMVAADQEKFAASEYRSKVCEAAKTVISNTCFKRAAELQAEKLGKAGGVAKAAEIVLAAKSHEIHAEAASAGA